MFKSLVLKIRKKYLVELSLVIIVVLASVIFHFALPKEVKFNDIQDLTFPKKNETSEEYIVVAAKYIEDGFVKNKIYQIDTDGNVLTKFTQSDFGTELSVSVVYQNQFDESVYLRKIGRVLPNYIWEYDLENKIFKKITFPFADNFAGVNSIIHYGNDLYIDTNASHLTGKQNTPPGTDGIAQSLCIASKDKCVELDFNAFGFSHAAFEITAETILSVQYMMDTDYNYSVKLNFFDENLNLKKEEIIEDDDFFENYAELIGHDNSVYLFSRRFHTPYAYKINESETKKIAIEIDSKIPKSTVLTAQSIIQVDDNKYVTIGENDTSNQMLLITIHDDKMSIEKINDNFSVSEWLNITHKDSSENEFYLFTNSADATNRYLYVYDLQTLELKKKISLENIKEDRNISFIAKL